MLVIEERYDKPPAETTNNIPPWDKTKEPFYFDYHTEQWVYRENSKTYTNSEENTRANGYKREKTVEEIIEEKLEEEIDGYKEATYWGRDYEFSDSEEDED